MKDKYLSIIINFGCHYSCSYCIVKTNNLHIPKTTTEGLKELPRIIDEYQPTIISLSGGGDPLFELEKHLDWYEELNKIIPPTIAIEVHTSYIDGSIPKLPYVFRGIERVVYHARSLTDLLRIESYWFVNTVRVVYVVTPEMRQSDIDFIYEFVNQSVNIQELSFRQMVDSNYNATYYHYDYLKQGHESGKWHYIEQNDYNLYYAENKVSFKYEDFKFERTN